jgi:hypothetical protein
VNFLVPSKVSPKQNCGQSPRQILHFENVRRIAQPNLCRFFEIDYQCPVCDVNLDHGMTTAASVSMDRAVSFRFESIHALTNLGINDIE